MSVSEPSQLPSMLTTVDVNRGPLKYEKRKALIRNGLPLPIPLKTDKYKLLMNMMEENVRLSKIALVSNQKRKLL